MGHAKRDHGLKRNDLNGTDGSPIVDGQAPGETPKEASISES